MSSEMRILAAIRKKTAIRSLPSSQVRIECQYSHSCGFLGSAHGSLDNAACASNILAHSIHRAKAYKSTFYESSCVSFAATVALNPSI